MSHESLKQGDDRDSGMKREKGRKREQRVSCFTSDQVIFP